VAPSWDKEQIRTQLRALTTRLAAGDKAATSAEIGEIARLLNEIIDRMEDGGTKTAEQFHRFSFEHNRLEQRLSRLENSVLFRSLRRIGSTLQTGRLKFRNKFVDSPFQALDPSPSLESDPVYESWIARQDRNAPSWEWHRQQAEQWTRRPLISVVMETSNPDRSHLAECLRSVAAQSYPCWELCICDDASLDPVNEYLASQCAAEPRIRCHFSRKKVGVSAALNLAAGMARGDYLAFLEPEGMLSPLALHYIAEQLQQEPADIIYSDEDFLNHQDRPMQPILKPAWSPDLLTSCMYLGHLLVLAQPRWREIGGFRSEYDGAQDYDAVLRIADRPARVLHVPRILYHSRSHPAAAAGHEVGRRALEDAVRRRHWDAQVTGGAIAKTYYVRRKLAARPEIGFVICSRNRKLLARCLQSLDPLRRRFDCHIVVVHHEIGGADGIPEVIRKYACGQVLFREPFNFSRMNNLGVDAARGDILFFVNDDVTPLQNDWLDHLLPHLERPEVGAVGPRLLYPSGAIQHAGVVIGMSEGAGHAGRGTFRSERWRWLEQTRNVSAVTGACLGMRRHVFSEAGGFDIRLPVNYNDIDLCLRVRQQGYEVIYEPHAVLRHDECQTRIPGTQLAERELFRDLWAEVLRDSDPFYSPLLDLESEEIKLGGAELPARTAGADSSHAPENGKAHVIAAPPNW